MHRVYTVYIQLNEERSILDSDSIKLNLSLNDGIKRGMLKLFQIMSKSPVNSYKRIQINDSPEINISDLSTRHQALYSGIFAANKLISPFYRQLPLEYVRENKYQYFIGIMPSSVILDYYILCIADN